jgi:hypothetical protein
VTPGPSVPQILSLETISELTHCAQHRDGQRAGITEHKGKKAAKTVV